MLNLAAKLMALGPPPTSLTVETLMEEFDASFTQQFAFPHVDPFLNAHWHFSVETALEKSASKLCAESITVSSDKARPWAAAGSVMLDLQFKDWVLGSIVEGLDVLTECVSLPLKKKTPILKNLGHDSPDYAFPRSAHLQAAFQMQGAVAAAFKTSTSSLRLERFEVLRDAIAGEIAAAIKVRGSIFKGEAIMVGPAWSHQ